MASAFAEFTSNAPTIVSVDDLPGLFHDVTPIPQNDGPNPACAIAYTEAFTIAYNYLRAMLKTGETSERSLQLTALCLKLNSSNYTVWHFRRQCLEALKESKTSCRIEQDLALAASLGGDNPKNYQIWYHRRALLEPTFGCGKEGMVDLTKFRSELSYINFILGNDGKNYHAWSHRQWLVRTVNTDELWKEELDFVDSKITNGDPRNNSLWNHRWFAAHQGQQKDPLSLTQAHTEAQYAIDGATLDPYNESPWRYLIGVLREQIKANSNSSSSNSHGKSEQVVSLLDEFYSKSLDLNKVLDTAGRDPNGCSNMVAARIDILELKGDRNSRVAAAGLAHGLACEHDTIRQKYWLMREQELTANP